MSTFALAIGVGTQNKKGEWLEVYYPKPILNPSDELVNAARETLGYSGGNQALSLNIALMHTFQDDLAKVDAEQAAIAAALGKAEMHRKLVVTILEEDTTSTSTPEVYLKLHLLSHRMVKPHEIDLSGIFGLLPNVAWTSKGAIDINELPEAQLKAHVKGEILSVNSVDKFPRMTDYVVPTGVRIADTSRVRLGAYLGEGTTIMHEGFVNFNAGTLGSSMIEGRISAGVVIGNGSDLGGGCSAMGTLSGGGSMVISVGEQCLVGANAGIGIPLGDRCTVEAGLYITAGTKVQVLDENKEVIETVKARELAGKSDMLFIRDSISGTVKCLTNKSAIALNEELHANN